MESTHHSNQDAMMPRDGQWHQRRASREGIEFGQDESTSADDVGQRFHARHERHSSRDDDEFLGQVDSSAVSMLPETVGRQTGSPLGESGHGVSLVGTGTSPFRTTYGNAPRRGAPGAVSGENGASERRGGESPYHNPTSGVSPLHAQSHKGRLGRKLGSASPAWEKRTPDGGTGFGSGTPGRTRPDKSPALPKFGEWDANNPASADGFTMIFEKARDEKKTGGPVRIPQMQAGSPLRTASEAQNASQESKFASWLSCCFNPSAVK